MGESFETETRNSRTSIFEPTERFSLLTDPGNGLQGQTEKSEGPRVETTTERRVLSLRLSNVSVFR